MRWRWGVAAATAATAISFGVIAPPERCPDTTTSDLRDAARSAIAWFERNQRPDGTWLYQYDRDRGEALDEYNVVRHAGVMMSLYQAADAGFARGRAVADRGLAWALDRVDRDGDVAALDTDGQRPVGASALLVAALVGRRAATGDETHDALLRRLGRFLVEQIEPTGAVRAYGNPAPGAPLRSKYYTGEAFWALALLARTFPDDAAGWRVPAARVGRYLATERDEVEDHWPPIPDHWAAYGMAELATAPGAGPVDGAVVGYARRQAELFGFQVRSVAQRFGPWGRVVRTSWEPRGGGYGVVGEALGQLWRLAGVTPGLARVRDAIAVRDACIAGLAVDAQERDGGRAVRGAWFRDGETRMDDQQHALSALLHALPIVATEPVAGREARPSKWLWAVGLVALADPARLASARRRRGVVVAAVAAAAVVAALSGPVLDAIDVSAPSARLAAAALMAVVGVAHLVRRPPLHLGLAAAPVVLLSIGADAGVLVVTPAAVVAATAASALPAWPALGWTTRGTSAVLVATALALGVDGVLAV